MSTFETNVGIAVALLTTPLLAFPLFDMLMGHCFFEQGCHPYEGIKVLGVLVFAGLLGTLTGWAVSGAIRLIARPRQ